VEVCNAGIWIADIRGEEIEISRTIFYGREEQDRRFGCPEAHL
jgi:hypothetical protein